MPGGFDFFGLSTAQFETLLLVFVRVAAMLSLIPVFSGQQLPASVRFGLAILLSFVVYHTVPIIRPLGGIGDLTAAIVSQVFVGVVFGFVAFLVFTGVQFAGEVIDMQMGFSAVNIINPITQQNVTLISELQLAVATLLFLTADAHHLMLAGISGSFNLVPLPFIDVQSSLELSVMGFFSQALLLVFKIAAPVAIALFVTNVALALATRVAPQINVFAVGFPLQIGVGLLGLLVSIPLLQTVLPEAFNETPRQLDAVLRRMVAP
jgi:flagellar biosynthetic protein FliR